MNRPSRKGDDRRRISFMDLPTELRLEVYDHLITPRTSRRASALFNYVRPRSRYNSEEFRPRFALSHSFSVSVLCLNRTIHREASYQWYYSMSYHFFIARTRDGYHSRALISGLPFFDYIPTYHPQSQLFFPISAVLDSVRHEENL